MHRLGPVLGPGRGLGDGPADPPELLGGGGRERLERERRLRGVRERPPQLGGARVLVVADGERVEREVLREGRRVRRRRAPGRARGEAAPGDGAPSCCSPSRHALPPPAAAASAGVVNPSELRYIKKALGMDSAAARPPAGRGR